MDRVNDSPVTNQASSDYNSLGGQDAEQPTNECRQTNHPLRQTVDNNQAVASGPYNAPGGLIQQRRDDITMDLHFTGHHPHTPWANQSTCSRVTHPRQSADDVNNPARAQEDATAGPNIIISGLSHHNRTTAKQTPITTAAPSHQGMINRDEIQHVTPTYNYFTRPLVNSAAQDAHQETATPPGLRAQAAHQRERQEDSNPHQPTHEELPPFMSRLNYPFAPGEKKKSATLEEDEQAIPPQLLIWDDSQLCGQNQPAYNKWPFPSMEVDSKTALIYDTVKSAGMHNHKGARLTLPTLLNLHAWQQQTTGHPKDQMIIDGLAYGFPLQYNGPPMYQAVRTENHSSATNYPCHLTKYVQKETRMDALAGPYKAPPFTPWFVTSRLMSREKQDSDDRRVIVDLSFPDGGINQYIHPHQYEGEEAIHNLPSVKTAVESIAATCPGDIHLSVIDLSRAYRQFPVSPLDWPLLGITVGNNYYFDKKLPFGARISSYVMQTIADFITRALNTKQIKAHMYLDDLLLVSANKNLAVKQYEQTIDLIKGLGLEVAHNKLQPPNPVVKWLGIVIDIPNNTLSIPIDKLQQIKTCLASASKRLKVSRRHIQRIIGMVNHLAKVVRAARLFIGRILAALRAAGGDVVYISPQVKADLTWFARYLSTHNAKAIIPSDLVIKRIWADACLKGAGASDGKAYYSYSFPAKTTAAHAITQLEAMNCMAAVRTFVNDQDAGGTIKVYCDNRPAVDAFTSGRAKDPVLAACARALWFHAAHTDTDVQFTHVPGEAMDLPDALSRAMLDGNHKARAAQVVARLGLSPIKLARDAFLYKSFL